MTKMNITKLNEEQRLVAGWASVVEENGEPIVDWQDDVITVEEIQKAAHGFMVDSRSSLEMHKGQPIAMVVESLVFTKDIQKSLGIDLQKQGWFIVVKVLDDSVWAKVKSGELKAFSIGGYSADKKEVEFDKAWYGDSEGHAAAARGDGGGKSDGSQANDKIKSSLPKEQQKHFNSVVHEGNIDTKYGMDIINHLSTNILSRGSKAPKDVRMAMRSVVDEINMGEEEMDRAEIDSSLGKVSAWLKK